jgi:hypothetical protein
MGARTCQCNGHSDGPHWPPVQSKIGQVADAAGTALCYTVPTTAAQHSDDSAGGEDEKEEAQNAIAQSLS